MDEYQAVMKKSTNECWSMLLLPEGLGQVSTFNLAGAQEGAEPQL